MTGNRFNPEKANKLIDPKRKMLVNPEEIISLMQVNQQDIIADLGAGNGFFTIPFAKNTKEKVYAVDIEPKMLQMLKQQASKEELNNILYIESDLEAIKLDSSSVNKAFVAFVMHEIPNMRQALEEFQRILKPGGRLMIVDWEAVESEMGPPLHIRISSNAMNNFLQESGLNSTVVHLNETVYAITIDMTI